jgi:TldD protein
MVVDLSEGTIGPVRPLAAGPRAADPPNPLLAADEFEALAGVAFTHAKTLGCSGAAVRIDRSRTGSISPPTDRHHPPGMTIGVPAVIESASLGVTLRVVHSGTWGFAQSSCVKAEGFSVMKHEIVRLTALAAANARANATLTACPIVLTSAPASRDRWATPHRKHPFDMSARAQGAFRQAVSDAARAVNGGRHAGSKVTVHGEETFYVSTSGTYQHGIETRVV